MATIGEKVAIVPKNWKNDFNYHDHFYWFPGIIIDNSVKTIKSPFSISLIDIEIVHIIIRLFDGTWKTYGLPDVYIDDAPLMYMPIIEFESEISKEIEEKRKNLEKYKEYLYKEDNDISYPEQISMSLLKSRRIKWTNKKIDEINEELKKWEKLFSKLKEDEKDNFPPRDVLKDIIQEDIEVMMAKKVSSGKYFKNFDISWDLNHCRDMRDLQISSNTLQGVQKLLEIIDLYDNNKNVPQNEDIETLDIEDLEEVD